MSGTPTGSSAYPSRALLGSVVHLPATTGVPRTRRFLIHCNRGTFAMSVRKIGPFLLFLPVFVVCDTSSSRRPRSKERRALDESSGFPLVDAVVKDDTLVFCHRIGSEAAAPLAKTPFTISRKRTRREEP